MNHMAGTVDECSLLSLKVLQGKLFFFGTKLGAYLSYVWVDPPLYVF